MSMTNDERLELQKTLTNNLIMAGAIAEMLAGELPHLSKDLETVAEFARDNSSWMRKRGWWKI